VKSSLSEFVVNSRALLDLHGVQIAAEAILKNEKPLPARGDHSSKNEVQQCSGLSACSELFPEMYGVSLWIVKIHKKQQLIKSTALMETMCLKK
jgi:hypothetical protein